MKQAEQVDRFRSLSQLWVILLLGNLFAACYRPGEESSIIPLNEWNQVEPSLEQWLQAIEGPMPSMQWKKINLPRSDNRPEKQYFLIQSTRLPPIPLDQAGILFERINQSFRVELDGKILMSSGQLGRAEDSTFQGFTWQLVPLPVDYAGKTLVIYSQSDYKSIGIRHIPQLGNATELMRIKVQEGWLGLISAAIMLSMSITVMLAWFNGIKSLSLISIAIYSLVSGLFLISINPISILLVHEPIPLAYIEMLTLFALPVAGIKALASVTDPRSARYFNRYNRIPTFFLLLALLGHLTGWKPLWNNYTLFNYLNLLSMAVISIVIIWGAIKGHGASIQVLISLLIVVAGAAMESLVSLRLIGTQFSVFNLTNLLCITVMLNIAIQHYFRVQAELQAERKKAESSRIKYVEDKERAVHTLVSGIAHEFNNPLAIIQMGIHGMRVQLGQNLSQQTQINRFIEIIEHGIQRIGTLNHRLLELSSIRDKQGLDIATNLSVLIQTLRKDWPDLVITGSDLNDSESVDLVTTPLYFKKVTDILINNAIESMAELAKSDRKPVELKINSFGDNVTIDCLDWGKGLDEDVLKNVFSPFFTTKEVGEGMGINLFFAREYIRSMGGELTIQNPSQPTCFRILLQRTSAHKVDQEI